VTSWDDAKAMLQSDMIPHKTADPLDFGEGVYFGQTTRWIEHHVIKYYCKETTNSITNAAVLVFIVPKDLFLQYPTGYTISSDDQWKDVTFYLLNRGVDDTVAWIEGPMLANTVQVTRFQDPEKLIINGQPVIQMLVRSEELLEDLSRGPTVERRVIYIRDGQFPHEST